MPEENFELKTILSRIEEHIRLIRTYTSIVGKEPLDHLVEQQLVRAELALNSALARFRVSAR